MTIAVTVGFLRQSTVKGGVENRLAKVWGTIPALTVKSCLRTGKPSLATFVDPYIEVRRLRSGPVHGQSY